MAVKIVTRPDGFGGVCQYFSTPETVADANAWLERTAVKHIKFDEVYGDGVVRETATGNAIIRAKKVRDICYFLIDPVNMKKFGIAYYDWYVNRQYEPGAVYSAY